MIPSFFRGGMYQKRIREPKRVSVRAGRFTHFTQMVNLPSLTHIGGWVYLSAEAETAPANENCSASWILEIATHSLACIFKKN